MKKTTLKKSDEIHELSKHTRLGKYNRQNKWNSVKQPSAELNTKCMVVGNDIGNVTYRNENHKNDYNSNGTYFIESHTRY